MPRDGTSHVKDKRLFRGAYLSITQPIQIPQSTSQILAHIFFVHAPFPIAAQRTREVHARLPTEAKHILHGRDREDRNRFPYAADQVPGEVAAIHTEIAHGKFTFMFSRTS